MASVVAIEKGLTPEDRVIINGIARARPGSAVSPEERTLKGPQIEQKTAKAAD